MKSFKVIQSYLILVLTIFFISHTNFAQNVGIGSTSFTPDASAGLEVRFTDKGLLPPRLSLTQTTNFAPLSAHVAGMVVYNTATANDVTPGLYVNDGTKWIRLEPQTYTAGTGIDITNNVISASGGVSSRYIGEQYGGGVIFHLWKDNAGVEHGLVVATTDQSTSTPWSNITDVAVGATAQSSWNGLGNSNAIVGQSGHTSSAAKLCLDLLSGGQSDWYLPSIDELSLLWHNRFNVNKTLSTISGATAFSNLPTYWSGTEYAAYEAWYFNFATGAGTYGANSKTNNRYVRAIRAF